MAPAYFIFLSFYVFFSKNFLYQKYNLWNTIYTTFGYIGDKGFLNLDHGWGWHVSLTSRKSSILVLLVCAIVKYYNLLNGINFSLINERVLLSNFFSSRSKETSKCGRKISTWHSRRSLRLFLNSHCILTTPVINYWTDVQQHGIWITMEQVCWLPL